MNGVLRDGGFHCRADFAVKVAHMTDLLWTLWNDGKSCEAQEYFESYMRGDLDEDEIIQAVHKEHPAVLKNWPAADATAQGGAA